jgi:hypothetical protein
MRITVPSEVVVALGYDEKRWVVITTVNEKMLRELLRISKKVLYNIECSYVNPITRTIPVQAFILRLIYELDSRYSSTDE